MVKLQAISEMFEKKTKMFRQIVKYYSEKRSEKESFLYEMCKKTNLMLYSTTMKNRFLAESGTCR